MITSVLIFIAGMYCAATYLVNCPSLFTALDSEQKFLERVIAGLAFIFSPITVPIGFVVLAVVY